jgi:hypothetical protein
MFVFLLINILSIRNKQLPKVASARAINIIMFWTDKISNLNRKANLALRSFVIYSSIYIEKKKKQIKQIV